MKRQRATIMKALTLAPAASNTSFILFASALEADSAITVGAPSTAFLASR